MLPLFVRRICLPNARSSEDAPSGYKGLMIIELCFRSLKRTQIKMTPMYHWLPRRIESHVRICVLVLLIERIAELSCNMPWSQIRRALDTVQVSNFFNQCQIRRRSRRWGVGAKAPHR
jgi:hypothetical protein